MGDDIAADQDRVPRNHELELSAPQSGLLGRTRGFDGFHEVPLGQVTAEKAAEGLVNELPMETHPRTKNPPMGQQRRDHLLSQVNWDRKTDVLGVIESRRRDADDLATPVYQWPPRVPRVDWRIRLDPRLLAGKGRLRQEPVKTGNDPTRDRLIQPERIANGHDVLADPELVGVAQRHGRELAMRGRRDPQHRKIEERVGTDQLCHDGCAMRQRDPN
jgi:hypothetical protein